MLTAKKHLGFVMSEYGMASALRTKMWPIWSVAIALFLCKGLLVLTFLLAAVGLTVVIPLGLWAAAVDVAVLVAVAAFWRRRQRSGQNLPFGLAAVGAVMVIANMHGFVPPVVEWAGLALLVLAAWLDWQGRKG